MGKGGRRWEGWPLGAVHPQLVVATLIDLGQPMLGWKLEALVAGATE